MADAHVTTVVIDASAASKGAAEYTNAMDRAAAAVDKLAKPQQQLADLMSKQIALLQAYRTQMDPTSAAHERLAKASDDAARGMRAANDNAKQASDGFRITGIEAAQMGNHLKQAALLLYAVSPAFRQAVNPAIAAGMRAIGPAAVSAGGAVLGALSPALAFLSRLALPVFIVVEAFRAMAAITELGAEKLKEFNEIAAGSGKAGTSTDFFQRQTLGAKELAIGTDAATAALQKFNEASTPKLGGSVFEKRLDQLTELGNFAGNAGVAAVKQATSTEERYRAAVSLITDAIAKGERLAALDLAATFLPPEMLERLRANGEALKGLQETADKIKPAKIASPEEIGYAAELQTRLDAAHETLSNKFKPIQKDLTQLGLSYQESWVSTVEWMAKAVTHASALYDWLKGIPAIMAQAGNASWIKSLNEWMEKQGWNSTPESMGLTLETPGGQSDKEAAAKQLAALLRQKAEVQRAMRESTDIAFTVFGDKSVAAAEKTDKAIRAGLNSYELLAQRTRDRVQELGLEAQGYGRNSTAYLEMKTALDLERAAKQAGLPIDQAKRKEIEELSRAYAKASQLSAQVALAQRVKFGEVMSPDSETEKPQPAPLKKAA